MKIKYIFFDDYRFSEEHYAVGFSNETKFDITPNYEYEVYGMCIWRKILMYLLCDDYNLPCFYPSELFKVVQYELPTYWKFTTYDNDEYSAKAIWGYPELVDDDNHYIALQERDKAALKIFLDMKSKFKGQN
ncbi:hypothetical protein [Cyanothece sp. BG0011]|uniref:hypothetical protein n=1 Tax=Cyanothece sp. BG0011 TaxID=2082950 RepID=UPI000D1ECDE2|nr:hypothetical protein [Cyanothece sp. BG0011]